MEPSIKALLNDSRAVITPADVSPILGCERYAVNVMVNNGECPFPAFKTGNRVKIPRIPFLKYLGYEAGVTQR